MKSNLALLPTLFLLQCAILYAQPPDTLWTRLYSSDNSEGCYSVQQTYDGGFIMAGYSRWLGPNTEFIYLAKTDSSGNIEWENVFGDSTADFCYCVRQTTDGGYILAGTYLMKVDSLGELEWSQPSGARSVQQLDDGGYIFVGENDSEDINLMKIDCHGNLEWQQIFGGSGEDQCESVLKTTDGGFILGGWTNSFGTGSDNMYLIKTDSLGNEEWEQTFGGENDDRCYSLLETDDAGYILGGYTVSFGPIYAHMYLVKTDSQGNLEWEQTHIVTEDDYCRTVLQTVDGGYILAGYTFYQGGTGAWDFCVIKTDSQGNMQHIQTVGDLDIQIGYEMQQTSDGGFIMGGISNVFGTGNNDMYLVKFSSDILAEQPVFIIPTISDYALWAPYPNPFNPSTVLSYELPVTSKVNLTVYDVSGRQVAELANGWRDAGVHEVTFDGSNVASGVYIYRLTADDYSASGKMLLMK